MCPFALSLFDCIAGAEDERLSKIREERGYNYSDVISVAPDKLPNYETKIIGFYEEHIHIDEEIRFCLEGSGYFDVRDEVDRWIRVALQPGDMIVLPEGINHRFTTDVNNYIKAMRLFVGDPVWTPFNRKDIPVDHPSRLKYMSKFVVESQSKEEA